MQRKNERTNDNAVKGTVVMEVNPVNEAVVSSERVVTPEKILKKQHTIALSALTKARNKLAGLMADSDNL